ncbi:PepSY domain-containing protein [Cytophagaceae bacterium YF14B1]|uniref:PepSY domain-containing protein n=1 Tax=Xanthocytophaga flava TaxID=3048013 RepID=A0AAE3QSX3_9BACT|nr:PepSY domain-containing protein [Xanthocytophaga flavus]MDJ1484837.1 PepSY domain-containing protein [Xanthocytophaga flavus]
MKRSFHFLTRKLHRYLGLVLGIQFLFWTIGGLYFSWSDMDEVHGDHQRKAASLIPVNGAIVSPIQALQNLRDVRPIDSVAALSLIQILGKPVYQIKCQAHGTHQAKTYLADALTGKLRSSLSKEEAIQVAQRQFTMPASVVAVEYLTTTNGHHEYREQPLPAYAVTFDHPSQTRVYVAAELGTVQKFRNNKWRIFDFLWMLHTMDYQSRDNIGNWALRLFSILGLLTIASGFVLYWVSSKQIRKLKMA